MILSLVVLFATIISIISVFTGEASGFDFNSYDTRGFFELTDNILTTYPLQKTAVSCITAHIVSISIGCLIVFAIYSILKLQNEPIKRIRIEI